MFYLNESYIKQKEISCFKFLHLPEINNKKIDIKQRYAIKFCISFVQTSTTYTSNSLNGISNLKKVVRCIGTTLQLTSKNLTS